MNHQKLSNTMRLLQVRCGLFVLMGLIGGGLFGWNLNVTGPITPIYFGQFDHNSPITGTTFGSTQGMQPTQGDQSFGYQGGNSVDEEYGVWLSIGWGWTYETDWAYSAAFDVGAHEIRVYPGWSAHLDTGSFDTPMVGWTITYM